jgi:hypothetical protein
MNRGWEFGFVSAAFTSRQELRLPLRLAVELISSSGQVGDRV